jgi:hypothetical protein
MSLEKRAGNDLSEEEQEKRAMLTIKSSMSLAAMILISVI